MDEYFVVSFDESIIFKIGKDDYAQFYDEKYETFDSAKSELIAYLETVVSTAKRRLLEAKKMKKEDIKTFGSL